MKIEEVKENLHPSDALRQIFRAISDLNSQPYNQYENRACVDLAYTEFDKAITQHLLTTIKGDK